MRRFLTILSSLPVLVLHAPAARAQYVGPAGSGETITLSKIVILVTDVANVFITIAVTITVAFIIYGGFRMATAKENPDAFKKGRTTLTNAIIGLVVILGVGIIIRTIGSFATSPTSILR